MPERRSTGLTARCQGNNRHALSAAADYASLLLRTVTSRSTTSSTILATVSAVSNSGVDNSASSATHIDTSDFPVAAIVGVSIVGGLMVLFIAYRAYRRFSRRRADGRGFWKAGSLRSGEKGNGLFGRDDDNEKESFGSPDSPYTPIRRIDPPALLAEPDSRMSSFYNLGAHTSSGVLYNPTASTRNVYLGDDIPSGSPFHFPAPAFAHHNARLAPTDSFRSALSSINTSTTITDLQTTPPNASAISLPSTIPARRGSVVSFQSNEFGQLAAARSTPQFNQSPSSDAAIPLPQPVATPRDSRAPAPPNSRWSGASTASRPPSVAYADATMSTNQQRAMGARNSGIYGRSASMPAHVHGSRRSLGRLSVLSEDEQQSPPPLPSPTSAVSAPSQWHQPDPRYLGRPPSRRISRIQGAPHSRHSRINLVMPAPLAGRPPSIGLHYNPAVTASSPNLHQTHYGNIAAGPSASSRPSFVRSFSSQDERLSVVASHWFNGPGSEAGETDSLATRPGSGESDPPLSASSVSGSQAMSVEQERAVAARALIAGAKAATATPQSPLDKLKRQLEEQARLQAGTQ